MRSLKYRAGVAVLTLAFVMTQMACTANWITVAMQDLPLLTQMALNIATLASTLQSGNAPSQADLNEIQSISNQAKSDLTLIQTLYSQYKANPSAGTLQAIEKAISDIQQNLPALLSAAHIGDPVLSARVTAAVSIILTTVESFAALLPTSTGAAHAAKLKPPTPKQLKAKWNAEVYPQFR